MKYFKALAMIAAVMLVPSIALADGGQTFGQSIGLLILEGFLLVAGAPIAVLVGKAVMALAKKMGLEVDAEVKRQTDAVVMQGIAFAEEHARRALRAGEAPRDGDSKKIEAIEFIRRRLDESNLPSLAEDKIADLIDSRIGDARSWGNLEDGTAAESDDSDSE